MADRVELGVVAAVWAVALGQLLRIGWRPVTRRIARHFPLAAAAGFAATLLAAAAIVWMSGSPVPRRASATVAALGMAAATWRARPSAGRSRGVPPGSLSLGASLDAIDQRDFYERQAERHGPVFKSSQYGQPVVCVTGTARGRELLLRQRNHLEGARLPYADHVPEGVLRYMSDEDHREIGRLFRSSIAETDLARFEAEVRGGFHDALVELVRESRARPEQGVRAEAAIGRGVLGGLLVVYLGLGPDDPERAVVEQHIRGLDLGQRRGRRLRADIRTAISDIGAALDRAHRGGRLSPFSSLGRMLAERPRALEDAAVAANVVLVLRMAYGDMTALLHWVLKMLSDNADWLDRVRDPAATTAAPAPHGDLPTRIVMETLRLEQSEFVYRRAAHDFEWAGYTIPAGWLIRVCVQEGHRDPAVFENPTRFDPDRFARETFSREAYSPFGADAHGCMGPAIVHFLGRLFVEELAQGFEFHAVSDGPRGRGIRHWQHWTPSPKFRIAITERGAGAGAPAGRSDQPGATRP